MVVRLVAITAMHYTIPLTMIEYNRTFFSLSLSKITWVETANVERWFWYMYRYKCYIDVMVLVVVCSSQLVFEENDDDPKIRPCSFPFFVVHLFLFVRVDMKYAKYI